MPFKTFQAILGISMLLLIYVQCKNIIIERETKNVNETNLKAPCKLECRNGGTCVDSGNAKFCICTEGTSGDLCETVNDCSKENVCGNKGDADCVYEKNAVICRCKDSEKNFNPVVKKCQRTCKRSNQCLNGGVCVGTDAGENFYRFCKCKSGTSGDFCENVKGCDTINCGSEGNVECAYDGISEGYCKCKDKEYLFDPAEKKCRKFCDNDKSCYYGGECIEIVTGKNGEGFCKCKSGTSGDLCASVNDCDNWTVDCGYQAGVECTYDGISGGYCECYESDHSFDHVEKMCRSRCLQKCGGNPNTICTGNLTSDADIICGCKTATMVYLNSTRFCVDRCRLKCGYNPNVICTGNLETDADTICDCENTAMVYIRTTRSCEAPTPCILNPCKNGGDCSVYGEKVKCTCKNGYTGDTCEIAPALCIPNPCKNEGDCSVYGAKAKCMCKNGYTGDTCEIGPCSSNPCKNRGFCYVDHNEANCICRTPFSGEFCETDPCSPNPCQNSGSCLLEGAAFKCICKERFSGTTCENESKWMLSVALAIAALLCLLLVCATIIGYVTNRNLKIIARGSRDYKA